MTQPVWQERSETAATMCRLREVGAKMQEICEKPLLFVDIDGVVSLFGFGPDTRPEGTWHNVDGVVHFLSAEAGRHLLELRADYELVWCSGWEEKCNEYLPAALGLPEALPFLTFERNPGAGRAHWKLAAVEAHAGERPLAWIDDAFNAACHEWAARRAAPTLLVETAPASGLTAAEAGRLGDWARAAGAQRASSH